MIKCGALARVRSTSSIHTWMLNKLQEKFFAMQHDIRMQFDTACFNLWGPEGSFAKNAGSIHTLQIKLHVCKSYFCKYLQLLFANLKGLEMGRRSWLGLGRSASTVLFKISWQRKKRQKFLHTLLAAVSLLVVQWWMLSTVAPWRDTFKRECNISN